MVDESGRECSFKRKRIISLFFANYTLYMMSVWYSGVNIKTNVTSAINEKFTTMKYSEPCTKQTDTIPKKYPFYIGVDWMK